MFARVLSVDLLRTAVIKCFVYRFAGRRFKRNHNKGQGRCYISIRDTA